MPADNAEKAEAERLVKSLTGVRSVANDIAVRLPDACERSDTELATFHRLEWRSGSFSSPAAPPLKVAAEKVDAKFRNGVLTVSIQKGDKGASRKKQVQRCTTCMRGFEPCTCSAIARSLYPSTCRPRENGH
ncbi:MAG: Hsp20/alpha crystallin family protein [Planctomycetaceae bacterium]|nr:Hsp20/alpha crystallin family protein [Planctomycetaceae bacterium]